MENMVCPVGTGPPGKDSETSGVADKRARVLINLQYAP